MCEADVGLGRALHSVAVQGRPILHFSAQLAAEGVAQAWVAGGSNMF